MGERRVKGGSRVGQGRVKGNGVCLKKGGLRYGSTRQPRRARTMSHVDEVYHIRNRARERRPVEHGQPEAPERELFLQGCAKGARVEVRREVW